MKITFPIMSLLLALMTIPTSSAFAEANPNQVSQIVAIEISAQAQPLTPNMQMAINDAAEKELMAFTNPVNGCPLSSLPLTDSKWKALRAGIYNDIVLNVVELYPDDRTKKYGKTLAYMTAKLTQPDVDQLYAFYQSPKGEKYQSFRKKIDALIDKSQKEDMTERNQPKKLDATVDVMPDVTIPSNYKEVAEHGSLMTFYSGMMPEIMTSGQPDLGPGIGGMVGQAMALKNSNEFESLYNEYKNDFDDFKKFRLSPAYQAFFKNYLESQRAPSPLESPADYAAAYQKKEAILTSLRAEWKNFCTIQMQK